MVKTVSTKFAVTCLALAGSLALVGCVDARGAFDEYGDRVVDGGNTDVDGEIVSALPNVDGEWLIAVRPFLPEDRIIQFRATLDLTPITENTGKIDITAQPLDFTALTPVGEAFVATDRPVASDASFEAPFLGVLPGAANPVSQSDADVDATLVAQLKSDQFLCGSLEGQAGPLPLDERTTWAAIRITGDTLPAPIFRCEDQPSP
jgi:hypothetical protein